MLFNRDTYGSFDITFYRSVIYQMLTIMKSSYAMPHISLFWQKIRQYRCVCFRQGQNRYEHSVNNRCAGSDWHGTLTRYVKLRVVHAPEMPGTFPRYRGLAIPTCIMARAWRTTQFGLFIVSQRSLFRLLWDTINEPNGIKLLDDLYD